MLNLITAVIKPHVVDEVREALQGIGVQAPLYGGAVVMSIVLIMVGLVRHRTKRREDQQGV